MHMQPMRRSSLFLLELVIAILFFSLTSAICVQIFVKSHLLEKESIDLNHAVSASASVAEIFRSQEYPLETLMREYPYNDNTSTSLTIYYDETWKPCPKEDVCYSLTLNMAQKDSLLTGTIVVSEGESFIYTLEIQKYLEKEVLFE